MTTVVTGNIPTNMDSGVVVQYPALQGGEKERK